MTRSSARRSQAQRGRRAARAAPPTTSPSAAARRPTARCRTGSSPPCASRRAPRAGRRSSSRAARRCARRPRAGTSGRAGRTRAATARRSASRPAGRSRCCRAGWRRRAPAPPPRYGAGVERQRVARDDGEPARIVRGDLRERRDGALVALDRDHAAAPSASSARVSPPGPGTDLDHRDAVERAGGARDAAGQVEVEQEILAERFARGEAVAPDDVAQRRQVASIALISPRAMRVRASTQPRRELERRDQARRARRGRCRRCRTRCRGRARCARTAGRASR